MLNTAENLPFYDLPCDGLWPYAGTYVKDLVFICGLAKPSFMKEVTVLIFEELF